MAEHRAIHENWIKILNFCITVFFPYLALSNTPYLGSDVTLLAFVQHVLNLLLNIPNQYVLSSIDTFFFDKSLKRLIKETNRLLYISYSTKIVHER